MNVDTFNEIVGKRMKRVEETLLSKAEEYAVDGDRFHNFRSTSNMNDETPLQSAWGMISKHVISVRDLCKGKMQITEKLIEEKVGDWIVYGYIMEAMMREVLDSPDRKADNKLPPAAKYVSAIEAGMKCGHCTQYSSNLGVCRAYDVPTTAEHPACCGFTKEVKLNWENVD